MTGKIYYLLATQHNNMGDLLINKMLIDEVSKYGVVYLDSEGVDSFKSYLISEKVLNANDSFNGSLKRSSFFNVLTSLKGFSHFFTSAGPSGRILTFRDFVNQVYLSLVFTILRLKGIKIYQVGTDLVLKTRVERLIGRYNNILINSTWIRSKTDVESARKLGFKSIDYIPDMAFLYKNFDSQNIVKNRVLISFRDLGDEKYEHEIVDFLEESIGYFSAQGLEVCFFYQVGSDREFNLRLFEHFRTKGCVFKDECLWYDDIDFYSDSKYVISNRLHVLLLGLVHHSIPLSVLNNDEKTSKIKKIFTDLGLEEVFRDRFKEVYEIDRQYGYLLEKVANISSDKMNQCQRMIGAIFNSK